MAQKNKNNSKLKLEQLLHGLSSIGQIPKVFVPGIHLHSGNISKGDVFFAFLGGSQHGIRYAEDAVQRGAEAIVTDEHADVSVLQKKYPHIPMVQVPALKEKMSLIAARFYQTEILEADIVGITGTNGKTSCSHFFAQALQQAQRHCFVMGTLGNGMYPELTRSELTTPDPIQVQSLLAHARTLSANAVVMEVSSHALQQDRVSAVPFDLAIFTNLSRDHLDYHGTMENYFSAKKRLFQSPSLQYAVLNADDPATETLARSMPDSINIIRYGLRSNVEAVDISAKVIKHEQKGIRFKLNSVWGNAEFVGCFLGDFNIGNLLAVIAALMCLGWEWSTVIKVAKLIHAIPGRLEQLGGGELPLAIIDYAHTPDALENAINTVHAHRSQDGRVIVVFGCGGNRDQGKRAQMGRIAENLADHMILTDDNPRDEDPKVIVSHILSGIQSRNKVHVEHDRATAIRYALVNLAKREDVVLIAGKGHEDYQLVGSQRLHFSDKEQVQQCLQELAA